MELFPPKLGEVLGKMQIIRIGRVVDKDEPSRHRIFVDLSQIRRDEAHDKRFSEIRKPSYQHIKCIFQFRFITFAFSRKNREKKRRLRFIFKIAQSRNAQIVVDNVVCIGIFSAPHVDRGKR